MLAEREMTVAADAIRLEVARLADMPAIKRVIEASARGLMREDYSLRQIESSLRYLIGPDRQMILDGTYYVAKVGRQIVGGGGWSFRTASDGKALVTPDTAIVRTFYVHPNWARRGLGRRLLERCEADARAAGFTRLELIATPTGARLYAAHGFTPLDEVEFVLPDGVVVVGVRMEKRLD